MSIIKKKSVIHFPKIDFIRYFKESEKSPCTTNRSCKAGITLYKNRLILPSTVSNNNIIKFIADEIKLYKKTHKGCHLKNVFFGIQAWGGISSNRLYCETLILNWRTNWRHYKRAIEYFLSNKIEEGLKEIIDNIEGVNMPFATKHLHFWKNRKYPVFDGIICKELYGHTRINSIGYLDYYKEMKNKSKEVCDKEDKEFNKNPVRNLEAAIFQYLLNTQKKNCKTPCR
jgi:hypothetical protein